MKGKIQNRVKVDSSARQCPLREFHYGQDQSESVLRRRFGAFWYFVMPVVVFLGICVFGICVAIGFYVDSEASVGEADTVDRGEDSAKVRDEFLTGYIRENGGAELLLSTQLELEGVYSDEFGVYVFSGVADFCSNATFGLLEANDSGRFVFKGGELEHGGDDVMMEISRVREFVRAMEDKLLACHVGSSTEFIHCSPGLDLGVEVMVVALRSTDSGIETQLKIRRSDLALIRREDRFIDGSYSHYRYSDYRRIGKLNVPTNLTVMDRDGAFTRVHFNTVRAIE
ncbi:MULTISPECIES: hypothetical protein [unclassified Lentimonas]|uniref:hypothetical protein n=1 Tax=unclassified Lentimonas TaxID=2630993 RepID=UPI0013215A4B|nr:MULTISPECIES: hypothetical protein [unclassified Lentimonas]CAA6677273.1 Unannotated [Lentimonas sp. CC4]CAA6686102.1 Unannotated [Lentimonas sp. CC6]CAA7074134.1 Unannotated [Lentimonas sp. CC4]CAA7171492.1 Unannotated [Lentimonas sp. CC21]CAA7181970.1 Unannotated [Lentimonas sp. CC8]